MWYTVCVCARGSKEHQTKRLTNSQNEPKNASDTKKDIGIRQSAKSEKRTTHTNEDVEWQIV